MKIELMIKGLKKIVTISLENTKGFRDEYMEKVLDMEEFVDDENKTTREKYKKTNEFLGWIEDLSIKLSNLSDEDKEVVKNNIELSDELRDALRSKLQPVQTDEKKS